ncbi:esterase [Cellulomonas chitinilytica]|uniref:Esterase n=1 Tax=Cellulomonas chitinilytica TaxID=398759 RepID=A0A919U3E4_9CELL|nr:alpha/beta hydrolase [Cellulomonas chitinilytica]GIG22059.1 esterase [Cellulomonas chitinilytica]
MRIILVPGLWLDGASWAEVVPGIEAAGHVAEAVTPPGLESRDADRSGITLQDHVDALVARVDAADRPVVLVGHSGGASVVSGAADARPDRVARAIYVDAGPAGEGGIVNDELPAENGEIPLPDLGAFEEPELRDLDEALTARFRAMAIPSPERVSTDPLHLTDERRYDVPTTVIATSTPGDLLRQFIAGGHPYVRELSRMKDYEIVDLPTGHWPQLTKPVELAAAIVAAVDRTS